MNIKKRAPKKPADHSLSLVIETDSLSAADLRKAVDAFTRLVEEVTKGVLGEDKCPPDAWNFSMHRGSIGISASANEEVMPVDEADAVTGAIVEGLEAMEESPYTTYDFACPRKAFGPIARLCGLVGTKGDSKSVKVLRGADSATDAITLNGSMKDNAKRAASIGAKSYNALGAIDGIVDVLTIREPRGIRLSDRLTGNNVVCIISDEALRDKAESLYGKRVEVEGLITYDKNDYPTRMEVKTIRKLPGPGESPDPSRVVGIFRRA